jgi:hypothetical protein
MTSYIVFQKNYNLAPQTISYFMDNLPNYQHLDSSSQTIKTFEKAFWRNMPIIPMPPVIFQLKNKFKNKIK